ncbi:DNA-binding transcriptional regulator, Lrp family [Modestobacter sp. DSM 44400]|uniref:Lrp/AsnC family transcriptional regulator n=1 Tax=Modestobacter sp. DSM 44400 TaxID=1550230 RepID=UPI0008970DFD|nr:Lrp/AsnC family transcriptional regulator [Modestobacter sp. DSM 44400]SDY31144.1 DNA-binding transcriptional regulator, Lrp family [Modestobacter sp. DSM 44400]
MQQSVALDEDDLALVEALQRDPRAPWTSVAEVVGTNAVTASRRWERLRATGGAWVTGAPGPGSHHAQVLAYVDVTCLPSEKTRVAQELAGDAHAVSVDITAGGRDLLLTVAAVDLATLGRYLLERLDRVPGVTGTRARIATRLYAEGSTWRLGVLPSTGAGVSSLPAIRRAVLDEVDRDLMSALGTDGRASYAALAQATGISQPTARRRVDRLITSGAVLLRTDVAAPLAGLPVMVVLSGDAPAGRLDDAAARLGRLRQVRLSATLAGTPSLLVVAWLSSLEEVHRFERDLVHAVPDVDVVDRLVVLRAVKRMGHLLDSEGRATGAVPMDVWRDPVPSEDERPATVDRPAE